MDKLKAGAEVIPITGKVGLAAVAVTRRVEEIGSHWERAAWCRRGVAERSVLYFPFLGTPTIPLPLTIVVFCLYDATAQQ